MANYSLKINLIQAILKAFQNSLELEGKNLLSHRTGSFYVAADLETSSLLDSY